MKNQESNTPYPLSFTAAALLPEESATLAGLFLERQDWEEVYDEIDTNALFNRQKAATRRRLFNELSLRLRTLAGEELKLLTDGSDETRRLLLWQAVCRAYPFVGNFVRKTLRPKIKVFDYRLLHSDYQSFFREEAEQYPRLEELAESTREKIQSRLFYFLEQVGILTPGDEPSIHPLLVPTFLCTCVSAQNPTYLEFWLLSDAEINRYTTARV
ncbi:DUF1819 family protein [Neolewinella aurantiaca]|uniref:DUF1819 family protein n=1 Tax=Neolewinella aurantiaca TaxID=2602767 RepID=A0A5C7FA79_9BACT|nr:DUF1819 family protein [Neolewinella aurantiaca]TXF86308.1 DUF1819 family protein [Neolewinella aurantiaca]